VSNPLQTDVPNWRAHRCHLTIMADDMEDVALQLERDAISMTYTLPSSRSQFACVIFDVALNRPVTWANNLGKSQFLQWFYIQTVLSFQVQHGEAKLASNFTALIPHGLPKIMKSSSPCSRHFLLARTSLWKGQSLFPSPPYCLHWFASFIVVP
jgi:hypothetical protein